MPITSAAAPPIANAFIAVMRDSEISLFENMPPPLGRGLERRVRAGQIDHRLVVLEHRDRLAHGLAVGERSLEDVVALGHAVDRDGRGAEEAALEEHLHVVACRRLDVDAAEIGARRRAEVHAAEGVGRRRNQLGIGRSCLGRCGRCGRRILGGFLLGEGRRRHQQRQRDQRQRDDEAEKFVRERRASEEECSMNASLRRFEKSRAQIFPGARRLGARPTFADRESRVGGRVRSPD